MTKGSTSYTWTRGRLLASVGGTTFEYDAKGKRTKKGTTEYYYDGDRLIAEIRPTGTLYFFYDESGVCGMRYNNTNYEFIRNIFGDVVAICNEAGGRVAFYSYDAWGNCTIEINQNNIANINPFRYRGYYYDVESGLYYLMSRYYDPQIGRFISPDTQDYLDPDTIGGVDLYAYGLNNPVMYVDPTGHEPEWLQGLAIGLAVVGVVLVVGAITVLTCGVGTLAGTMAGAVVYGAAQGIAIGAAVGVVGGGIVGGIASDWSTEGILIGMGIGLGAGAIVGGVIGGFAGASSFTANSSYISQYGGDVKEVLSTYKGNPKLKVLNKNTTVYRTWGGESSELGHWITPKNYGASARSMLSLPPWNTATNTSQFLISKATKVLSGKAAALFGQTGGGIQWWIGLL